MDLCQFWAYSLFILFLCLSHPGLPRKVKKAFTDLDPKAKVTLEGSCGQILWRRLGGLPRWKIRCENPSPTSVPAPVERVTLGGL